MTISLPADPPGARSLTGVVPQVLAALEGRSDWFAPATSAIVLVADGLGAHNLSARAGHARFLSGIRTKRDVARTVFPATTAAALTSLLTGTPPGVHGLVGYRVLDPERDVTVNQLKGWDEGAIDPLTWQRAEPLMAREAAAGRPCFVVSKAVFTGSGFTAATLRGAQVLSAPTAAGRVLIAADLAARHPGALIYVYTSALDTAGHKHGWQSEQWSAALERVDAAVRALSNALPRGAGAVVTADHGMVDVPRHRQVLFGADDGLADGVRHVGGHGREVEQHLGDVDPRDAVDHRVVALRDQGEAAVGEPLDHPHLPQWPGAVELLGEDPPGELQQLAVRAGPRERGLADVVLDVERRVVDPERPAGPRGRDLQPLAVARDEVQAHPQRVEQLVERRRRTLEPRDAPDVHVRVRPLLVQEGRVDRGEAVEVLLRH